MSCINPLSEQCVAQKPAEIISLRDYNVQRESPSHLSSSIPLHAPITFWRFLASAPLVLFKQRPRKTNLLAAGQMHLSVDSLATSMYLQDNAAVFTMVMVKVKLVTFMARMAGIPAPELASRVFVGGVMQKNVSENTNVPYHCAVAVNGLTNVSLGALEFYFLSNKTSGCSLLGHTDEPWRWKHLFY
ncbi:hypothetical protein CYLTODRAFT_489597 [Cylindrobasidium torrendii FP15055 ss-10]|uniref:Uncharacterized protein n=1 Tax=Cylindrobasidium torrendii FP15055 ss-10 TaxID=1314674 RepID=A0A0D7BDU4_9AGAR|nr:hypothetical protein CYLTODRAFT_489597 [Cylindrobasidium torrendii FP15055 ss-10]